MVDWSKTAEEGIIARNSFGEWNVVIPTLHKESFLLSWGRYFLKREKRFSSNELLASEIRELAEKKKWRRKGCFPV